MLEIKKVDKKEFIKRKANKKYKWVIFLKPNTNKNDKIYDFN